LEARYKAIDRALVEYRPTQVLELASGFLPRGLEMSLDPRLTFVESDLPEVIQAKQQLVRTLAGDRPNLHFAEIDAAGPADRFAAASQHFAPDQAVAVVCEGLLIYLDMEEKRRVCGNVRQVLEKHGGVWITADFTATVGLREAMPLDAALQKRVRALLSMTGR